MAHFAVRARVGLFGLAVLVTVVLAAAVTVADEPMFVRWLVADDPGDETIREYWEAAERDELTPPALIDLGTMLFYRGYPKDAVRYYRSALDEDPDLYEAWFRIGLVEHSEGNLYDARQAYKRCLKKLTGHGWCNFYMGLLEEQLGHSSNALYYYRRAFKFAPELANPRVNPEVLSSDLALGAQIQDRERRRFKGELPKLYLEPGEVARVKRKYEASPVPVPEPAEPPPAVAQEPSPAEPRQNAPAATPAHPVAPPRPNIPRRAPQPTPKPVTDGASGTDSDNLPYGVRMIESVSSEARFAPQ